MANLPEQHSDATSRMGDVAGAPAAPTGVANPSKLKQPQPDVFERRVIREKNRKIVDANAKIGRTYGGGYAPVRNPYGGPPAGGSDAAGSGKRK